MMKKLLLTAWVTLSLTLNALALTPLEIIEKSDQIDDGETSISETTMILIDKNKHQRIRKTKGYRKDYGEDKKSISIFLSPADVRNTTFMSFEWSDENKDDDNWLYLPALRKVKRIASGNKKDSFMGTDFTYHDMNGLKVSEWSYRMLKETVVVNGKDTWLIGAVPRKDIAKTVVKDTGYTKRLLWIQKDNFLPIQGKIWMERGKYKVMKASDISLIDGILTVGKMEMNTFSKQRQRLHSTVLLKSRVEYNQGVKDSLFSTATMEKGL
jgi:hypothetical protein